MIDTRGFLHSLVSENSWTLSVLGVASKLEQPGHRLRKGSITLCDAQSHERHGGWSDVEWRQWDACHTRFDQQPFGEPHIGLRRQLGAALPGRTRQGAEIKQLEKGALR